MTNTAPARRTASQALQEAARDPASLEAPHFRAAPHNLEAEQALLGAILVNNEAHDRVSGFLQPHHFYDPLHAQIYETAAKLIATGKQVTPITLKTFFENAEPISSGLSVPAYLGQLAANATTIINVRDYGRTIYDLSIRRQLIMIGEDVVNKAYDSPVDFPPKEQIEEAETRLFSLAETGKYGQGFAAFSAALTSAIEMANHAYQRDGGLSGISTGLRALDSKLGGLQPSDLIILAGRPSMGKSSLATNIACSVARARVRSLQERPDLRPDDPSHDGAVVGLFSLEMSAEQLATRILSEQAEIPSEKIRRGLIDEAEFKRLVRASEEMADPAALYRPDRRPLGGPACGPLAQAQTPAAPGAHHRRLPATPHRLGSARLGEPRAGGVGDHHQPQGPGQGARTCRCSRCPSCRARSRTARTSARSSPTCASWAPSSRTPTWSCSCSARSIMSSD